MQMFFKPLLISLLLISHWPKELMWPSPEPMLEETVQWQESWEAGFIGGAAMGQSTREAGRWGFPGHEVRLFYTSALWLSFKVNGCREWPKIRLEREVQPDGEGL